uniref:Calx-beta domain-containing protein n=1 Tax=Amphimedon queenslandica TaxID=400682 RepID=A0A1X7SHX4_AMPQE
MILSLPPIAQLLVSVLNDSMISVAEGAAVKICLMLNGVGGVIGVNVSYSICGNTSDYSGLAPSGNIGFTTDVSCITLTITNDSIIGNNRSINIQFGSVTGATLSPNNNTIEINIMDNTDVSVSINSSVTVYDNSSSVELCATLSNDNITFDGDSPTLSATTEGNATSDVDYSLVSMDVIPNVPGCGSVSILNNGTVRGDRLLTINWTLMSLPQISGDRISLDTELTDINIIDTDCKC